MHEKAVCVNHCPTGDASLDVNISCIATSKAECPTKEMYYPTIKSNGLCRPLVVNSTLSEE